MAAENVRIMSPIIRAGGFPITENGVAGVVDTNDSGQIIISSDNIEAGMVLTADGNGGVNWTEPSSPVNPTNKVAINTAIFEYLNGTHLSLINFSGAENKIATKIDGRLTWIDVQELGSAIGQAILQKEWG